MSAPALRLVTPRFGPEIIGGAEAIARRIAQQLVARGWHVEAWTTTAVDERTWRGPSRPGTEDDGGILVRRFGVRMPRRPGLFHQVNRGFFRLPGALRPEAAWLALQGPYAPGLIQALRAAPPVPTLFVPYLFHPTLRGIGATRGRRILIPAAHDELPLRLNAVRRALTQADALWFSTPEERELVVAAHPVAAAKPFAIGTVGIDAPASVDAGGFAARHGVTGPFLYYGGRVASGKGVDILLDGFAQLRARIPAAQLVLSGEAGEKVSAGGVIGIGRVSDDERWEAIAACSAVVVPSRYESLSLLALEAWALGKPALLNSASPVLRGQAERSGGALLFATSDELATAAARLLGDAALSAQLGASGRDYLTATYTWDAVVARLESLIAGDAA